MTEIVNDTFSGESSNVALTSHTGETGATWTKLSGYANAPNVSPINHNLYSIAASEQGCYASGSPGSAEYDVEADLVRGISYPGILGRVSTSAVTFYQLRLSATGVVQLYKYVSGSVTLLDDYSGSIVSGSLKLEIRNATKKGYVDDVERVSDTDNSITVTGKAGVRFTGSSDTNSRIDNFVVTDTESDSGLLPILLTQNLQGNTQNLSGGLL